MSRTDVHRPVWVMRRDPTIRRWFADFHHHERGECTLDEFLRTFQYRNPLGCYRMIWTRSPRLCGCNMCTGNIAHRFERRTARTLWRAARQELLKARFDDLDDVNCDQRTVVKSYW